MLKYKKKIYKRDSLKCVRAHTHTHRHTHTHTERERERARKLT